MARGHTLHAIHVPSSSVFLSSLSHKLPLTEIVCPWTLIFTCFAFPVTGALHMGPNQHDGSFRSRSDGPCVQGACGHEHRQPSIALCQWRSVEPRSVGLATPLEQSSQTPHILAIAKTTATTTTTFSSTTSSAIATALPTTTTTTTFPVLPPPRSPLPKLVNATTTTISSLQCPSPAQRPSHNIQINVFLDPDQQLSER